MQVTVTNDAEGTEVYIKVPGTYSPDVLEDVCNRASELLVRAALLNAQVNERNDDGSA